MIPIFPKFKKLEITDKADINVLIRNFSLYSDFNFANMWAWDIQQKMRISKLNGNLVVLFYDYISDKPFLSFIGGNNISETAKELINFSHKKYKKNILRLIPEEVAKELSKFDFDIKEDRDHHDYIYSISHLVNMHNWPGSSSSQRIRQFVKKYQDYSIVHSHINDISKEEYVKIFKKWSKNKEIDKHFETNEYKLLKDLFY